MRWVPQKFNDTLAVLSVIGLVGFTAWVLQSGFATEPASMVLGAVIAWLGSIYQFYFRKSPPGGV